jgi:UDP-N-acetylmuramoylalanine-D-glutamate ligase
MLNNGKPDLVVAFPGGRGTENMVKQAEAAGVPVKKVGWV